MKTLWSLLSLCFAFLCPAVGDDDDPTLNLDLGGDDDDPPSQDDPPGDDPPQDDPPADPPPTVDRAAIEREISEKYQREISDLRANQKPIAQQQDPEFEREEAVLRNPEATPLEKWQVTANRSLRANQMAANSALAQAYDVADRTAFATLAIKEPALFKRYEARVEEELTKMRQKGQNAPREQIYTFLLGKEMREGKFTKKAAPKKPGATTEQPHVQRGRLPGARSDVGGRNAMTEHEKRTKRLENLPI